MLKGFIVENFNRTVTKTDLKKYDQCTNMTKSEQAIRHLARAVATVLKLGRLGMSALLPNKDMMTI